jgi:hypothetical protein
VRKSAKKIVTACDERWIMRQIKNNPKLSATKMTSEIENNFHKNVNPDIVRRVLRKNNFHGRVARKKSFVSQKYQKVRMEFAENHLRKGSNSEKQSCLLIKANIIYLV